MADCNACKESRQTVPYIVHEADMARQERTIKRLWILAILLVVLLVGSNCAWIFYESQFVDEVVTTEIDAEQETTDRNNYVVGGDMNG